MKRQGNFSEINMQFSGKTNLRVNKLFRHNLTGAAFHNIFDLACAHVNGFRNLFMRQPVNEPKMHDSPVPFVMDALRYEPINF